SRRLKASFHENGLTEKRKAKLLKYLSEIMTPRIMEARAAVDLLLDAGADPNAAYNIKHDDLKKWTPTLLAAEIGDLKTFEALLAHGGNWKESLLPCKPGSMERHDALWIAISYNNIDIVDFIKKI